MFTTLRGFVLSTAIFASFAIAPPSASAGPLLDWLLGRQTAYYPPGYAPAVAAPLGVAQTSYYAPQTVAPLPYRLAPVTSFYGTGNVYPTYSGAGYAAYSPAPSVVNPIAPAAATLPASGYGYPVTTAYSPATYPTANAYSPYPYTAGYAPSTPVTAYAYPTASVAPVAVAPTTVSTYPVYPAYPAYRPGLLGRLFRPAWPWGYGYSTNYYPAQVTYYRPVTALSPITGVPVTSLSACTSYQTQIQRLPTSALMPVAPPVSSGCGSCSAPPVGYGDPNYGAPSYGNAPTYGTPSPVYGQPMNGMPAYGTNPGQPSSTMPPANYGPGNVLPGNSPTDIVPVPQPQLSPTSSYYNYSNNYPTPDTSISPNTSSNYPPQGSASPNYPGSSYPSSSGASLYPQTPTPAPLSTMQPLSQPVPTPSTSGGFAQPRPIPAPTTTSPYFDSTGNKDPRSASQTAAFKTIQWTTRSAPQTQPQAPSAGPAATNRAAPVQQPRSRYDDSGWR